MLRIEEGSFVFTDVLKQTMTGRQRFSVDSMVVGGRLWHVAD